MPTNVVAEAQENRINTDFKDTHKELANDVAQDATDDNSTDAQGHLCVRSKHLASGRGSCCRRFTHLEVPKGKHDTASRYDKVAQEE